MKPSALLNLILFAIAIVLAYLLFREKSRTINPDNTTLVAAKYWQKIDSLSDRFDKRAEEWPKEHEQGGTTIDTSTARIYIQNYRNTEQRLTRDSNGYTKSVWIDAASLSNMLKTIVAHNGDGIRVYFSRYPYLKEMPDRKRYDNGAYDNRLSVIIFTTKAISDKAGFHQDVFFQNKTVARNGLGIISAANAASGQSGAAGYNYNDPTPPPSNTEGPAF